MVESIDFSDHVRKRPGMYLGSTGSSGVIELLKGLVADCMEVSQADSYFFKIMFLAENKYSIVIEASTALDRFMHKLEDDDFIENFHLKVCKILSVDFELTAKEDGRMHLTFKLDDSIFTEDIDYIEFSEVFTLWACLNKTANVFVIDKRNDFINQNYFSFPEGVKYFYDRLSKKAIGEPKFKISFDGRINEREYQIYLGYRTDWYPEPVIASFANDVQTFCGGSLINGIMKGLASGCRKYAKDNKLDDLKIRKKKLSNGLIVVATVRAKGLKYGGSFREFLDSPEVEKDVRTVIKRLTLEYFCEHEEVTDRFLSRFNERDLLSRIL